MSALGTLPPSPKRVALVTGATGHLGRAIVRRLADAGYHVALSYRHDVEKADRAVQECGLPDEKRLIVRGDITVEAACRSVVRQVEDRWERIDVLVNNAAATRLIAHTELDSMTREEFQRLFEINTIGAFQMSRAAAAALSKSEHASIVNISSASSLNGFGSSIGYAASKAALNSTTLSLARVLAPRIRVNALCPAFIEGDWLRVAMGEEAYQRFRTDIIARTPLRRAATVEDVSEAVLWLARDARHVTGEMIRLDGGLHLLTGR